VFPDAVGACYAEGHVMATSRQHHLRIPRDHIGVALAAGGLGVVILITVTFYGAGTGALVAIGVAAGYAFGLSAALVKRNTGHWRNVLERIQSEMRSRLANVEENSMFSPRFFLDRLAQECRRSGRYKLDLAVMRLRCHPDAVAKLGEYHHAATEIFTATATRLRTEDVAGRLSEHEYAFFLPHTNRAGAEIVLGRFDSLDGLVASVGIAVFGDDGTEPNDLLRAAGADAERRLRHAERERGWNQRSLVN
jgi:GGDEF domain-containing protein